MPRLRAASKSSPCISGRSLHLNSSPSPDTPRSNRSGPLHRTRCTGMASSTSLASISPLNCSGRCSSQATRGARCGANRSNKRCCRCRSSPLTSRMKYRFGKLPSSSSSSNMSSASLPVPAPNSRIFPPSISSSTCAACRAKALPYSEEIWGAVTKSPSCPNLAAPPL